MSICLYMSRLRDRLIQNFSNYKSCFVDVLNHDYHLGPNSVCKNNGIYLSNPVEVQFDRSGNPRNNPPDIGAYEDGSVPMVKGDINGDGVVNIQDVQLCANVISGDEADTEIVQRAREVAEPQDVCDEWDMQAIVNTILER